MGKYIIALDQGTTSSRSILYDAALAKIDQVQQEFAQHFPKPGWVEQGAQGGPCDSNFFRIMLDPAGLGKVLGELLLHLIDFREGRIVRMERELVVP